MKLLNDARYMGFYILNHLKKDSILKREKEVKKCMEDDKFNKIESSKKIKNLMEYAIANTEYYKEYKGKSFEEFPVVNKYIITKNIEQFKSKEFKDVTNHVMATSGSTGTPFKIEQDYGKRKQVLAEILYFSNLIGYRPGKKLVYLRNLKADHSKSKLAQFIQNESLIYVQKYDESLLKKIYNELSGFEKNTSILGYASTLHILATYMKEHDLYLNNISGIISGAEAINSTTRKLVEERFKCKVVSRYSNQEMGILAQDYEEDKFTLNVANYYFEILDVDTDKRVEDGQMGRIVITDFYNKATPMIRYDTGDLGIMTKTDAGYIISKICGRKGDILYTVDDVQVSFLAFGGIFEAEKNIEQFQVVQETRTELVVNLITKNKTKIDEEKCKEKMNAIMGEKCNIIINYIDTLPITNSGKFRYVICNYKPNKQ